MPPKQFDMPGQTKELSETDPSSEGITIFYETLHQQRPKSEMAIKWLLQHGKLPEDEAKVWAKKLGKDKKVAAVATSEKRKLKADDDDFAKKPAKKAAPPAKKKPSVKPDSSDEDDFDAKKKPAAKKPAAKPAAKKPAKPKVKADDSSDEE